MGGIRYWDSGSTYPPPKYLHCKKRHGQETASAFNPVLALKVKATGNLKS